MVKIKLQVRGLTPLMHHRMPEDVLQALLIGESGDKKKPKQTLTPRQIAERHAYQKEDGTFYIPYTYLTGAFIGASSEYKLKNSQRKSVKSIAGGCLMPSELEISLLDEKDKPIKKFEVDIKKATNHQKGAVAVCRPRFDRWGFKTEVIVDDTLISPETVHRIIEDSGRRVGMGSFRVANRGFYGQFEVTKWEVSK